jgi:hypothetical protein
MEEAFKIFDYKLLDCRNDRIGNFGKIIDARKLSAHSNGNINFSQRISHLAKRKFLTVIVFCY